MCFGVRDAIELVMKQAKKEPVTILGDLVHNEQVVGELGQRGVQIAREVGAVGTRTMMVTAHGASEIAKEEARGRGLNVVEATCPLVHLAHRAVAELVADGFHPVIVGKRDHVEVRGLTGDLKEFDVVLSEADVMAMAHRPKIGIAAQTTQPIDKVEMLVGLICRRFSTSEVRFADTVCQPTKQRQASAVEVARQADLMIVIGGAHSNNTHELVATCRKHCARVHHIQLAADLREEWFAGVETVGLTAGTSTPDASIAETERWLRDCADRRVAREAIHRPAEPQHRRAA